MALKADFVRDVATRCVSLMKAAGYLVHPVDDRDAIRTYTRIRLRRVRQNPRTVHKANYFVPAPLATGEQHLLAKVARGDDLWPHQSRKIDKVAAEDGMLNDYGIQHFHLGTTSDPKHPHLIKGTKELLFAVVQDDDFYALGIFDHSAWSKQSLFDIIQVNWPHLLAPVTVKDGPDFRVLGLARDYTQQEAKELRANNINSLQRRPDGTIHLGMGGGIAGDGSSAAATRDAMGLTKHVKDLEKEVLSELLNNSVAPDSEVQLDWRPDGLFAVTNPRAFEVDLTERLVIPPL